MRPPLLHLRLQLHAAALLGAGAGGSAADATAAPSPVTTASGGREVPIGPWIACGAVALVVAAILVLAVCLGRKRRKEQAPRALHNSSRYNAPSVTTINIALAPPSAQSPATEPSPNGGPAPCNGAPDLLPHREEGSPPAPAAWAAPVATPGETPVSEDPTPVEMPLEQEPQQELARPNARRSMDEIGPHKRKSSIVVMPMSEVPMNS